MEFTEEYFAGEIQEGFYVQPIMKRAWAAQLEVLQEIDRICKKHGLKYFAQWGTLLGAVRHHGFIPWDDDIDIALLRGDFEKLRRCIKGELPLGWVAVDYNDEKYDQLMIRVANSDKIYLNEEIWKKFHYCPYVVGIDIFCMDKIPMDKGEEEVLVTLLACADTMGVDWEDTEFTEKEKMEIVESLSEMTGYQFNEEKPIKKQLLYLADRLAASYWDTESEEVSLIYLLNQRPDYRIPIEYFDDIIEVPFETTTIPIPKKYDLILRQNYGDDYMTPKRVKASHDYPFFKKQMEQLREALGEYGVKLPTMFEFEYTDDEEENVD